MSTETDVIQLAESLGVITTEQRRKMDIAIQNTDVRLRGYKIRDFEMFCQMSCENWIQR